MLICPALRDRLRAVRALPACGRRWGGDDGGRAIIEVVFLAVLLLIPVVYIMIGALRLQSATLAVAQAARDVGRLIETTDGDVSSAAHLVAATDLKDQQVPTDALQIRAVAAGADCRKSPMLRWTREPGVTFDVCVIATVTLPGVPSVLSGSNNTVTGVYTVHISDLREGQ